MPNFAIKTPSGQTVNVNAASSYEAMQSLLGQAGPDVSQLGSFGRGAVSMLPLGDQAYAGIASLGENKPYTQERQELSQEQAQDKEVNPGSTYAGKAVGLAAPIVATGGLAAPESLLGAAGQGALFGGAYGAGNAVDTLASGGSGAKAAGDVALGAGLGAAGGAVGKTLGEFLGGLGRKAAVSAAKIGDEVEPIAAQAAAPSAAQDLVGLDKSGPLSGVAPTTPDVPSAIQAKQGFFPSAEELKAEILAGNLGGSPRQLRAMPGKDIVASLNHMGDIIKANSTPDNPLIGMTDRYSDRLQKFVALQNKAGKTIGDTIEKAGVPPLPTSPIADSLISSAKFLNPSDQAQLQSVIGELDKYGKLDGTPGSISFKRLQQLKGDLGDTAFHGQGNPVLQNAYHTISDIQDNELEKLGNSINKPDFTNAKQVYQMTSRAVPMLRMATARSLAKGYSSFGAPLAALVTGHPVAALGAALKEPLQRAAGAMAFGAPEIGETLGAVPSALGAQAAKVAPDVAAATDLHLQHPALAPWRDIFAKNAAQAKDPSEIAKANAVTDFTLSQRDPAYATAKQKASASPETSAAPEKPTNMAEGGLVTPHGFPEPQTSDNPALGAEIPPEQRALSALNTVGTGYGAGSLGGGLVKGAQVVNDLGEAGALFPQTGLVDLGNGVKVPSGPLEKYLQTIKDFEGARDEATITKLDVARGDAHDDLVMAAQDAGSRMPWESLRNHIGKFADDVLTNPPDQMADGGVVSPREDKSLLSQFKDNFGKPIPGFTSTLPGLQHMMEGNGLSPTPTEENTAVRTAEPDQFHQSFNPQMEEQLKAFMMGTKQKGEDDAE